MSLPTLDVRPDSSSCLWRKSFCLARPRPLSRPPCVNTPSNVLFPASTFPTTATLSNWCKGGLKHRFLQSNTFHPQNSSLCKQEKSCKTRKRASVPLGPIILGKIKASDFDESWVKGGTQLPHFHEVAFVRSLSDEELDDLPLLLVPAPQFHALGVNRLGQTL